MKRMLVAAALLAFANSAMAQDLMKVVKGDGLKWVENPIFKGVQMAVLIGDPTKADPLVYRLKFPPNYKVGPHTHPGFETVTVLSGSFGNGMGEKFDPSKGEVLPAGSIFALPGQHPHYVWTTTDEAVIQVQTTGPLAINFLDPADDPRKK